MEAKIKEIVSNIAEVEITEVGSDTDLIEELDVDSMMALEILTDVERSFQIRVPDEELPNFTSVRSISNIVKKIMG
ncbi:Meromycolate extension acyl carrier protein [Listeria grayi]|uniref:Acyl carrier protein n=1 Tax=Listeria grayi FSL F6-1183 TaxID=1265827 RepID=A0A829R4R5_LISGR|nr:acyl carrier protein [Listeria grayi]EUJ26804.1 acyl carrier protein [Listeria grayi FSL F6-1183]MBC1922823.1 acyl carrier protein [Listeria grayi]VEI33541.1 Meromycolate extension acyl carrier protein [Listeria grayi]